MVVDADGAAALIGAQPARAALGFAAVEQTGRDALAEIRRLLGVLRREDDELALAPQPTLAHVTDLVRRARGRAARGAARRGRRRGAVGRRRPDRVWRAGHRAARLRPWIGRHGARARGGGGHGLVGMRERVRILGGELHTGRRAGGGFEVRARIPLDGRAEHA
jgi:signal transduction histidine kinase